MTASVTATHFRSPLLPDFAKSRRLGMALRDGWSRAHTGHVLYASAAGGSTVPTDLPIGAAMPGGSRIDQFSFTTLPAGDYRVGVSAIGDCGCESDVSSTVRMTVDGSGHAAAKPNPPQSLTVAAADGYKVALSWVYDPTNQAVRPATFKVYVATGRGEAFALLATRAAHGPVRRYTYTTAAFDAADRDTWLRFKVAAVSADGGESDACGEEEIYMDTDAPAAVGAIAWEEVDD